MDELHLNYDMTAKNDRINFDLLHDRRSYELGSARDTASRLFFVKPPYLHSSESEELPKRHLFLRLLAPLACYLGYRLAMYESTEENSAYEGSTLTEFTSEDRIVDLLLN